MFNEEQLNEILDQHVKWLKGLGGEKIDLRGANLYGADLYGANLYGADLKGANLRSANLRGANLYGADLKDANLYGADLYGANLYGADLYGADLYGAYLRGAILPPFQLCPEEGDFIAWKKVSGGILKLLIPAGAKRTSSLVGRKCRAEYVKVLSGQGVSTHDGITFYQPDAIVYADKYDDDIRVECAHGIHFFMTKREAEEY
mgnify:CR=1 FL=1